MINFKSVKMDQTPSGAIKDVPVSKADKKEEDADRPFNRKKFDEPESHKKGKFVFRFVLKRRQKLKIFFSN